MPTVLAVATPGSTGPESGPLVEMRRIDVSGAPSGDWCSVNDDLPLAEGERAAFRITLTITLTNTSDQIAQIAIIDRDNGNIDLPSGESIVLRPHDSRAITWQRTIGWGSLQTAETIGQSGIGRFRLRLWVRDLGMNAYDEHLFNGDLQHFKRDGSRLIVSPVALFPWTENVATPLPGRVYERLDAADRSPVL